MFRLNFSCDMIKTHYFSRPNKSLKNLQALGLFAPKPPLTFDVGDLKMHDLAKLCFLNKL